MSKALIDRFYTAFAEGDASAMAACYHPDVRFEDPAFGVLHGAQAGAMWHMLLSNASSGLRVEHHDVHSDGTTGRATWVAHYRFGPQQRPVVNHITAEFQFADGLIVAHTDLFDFWRWARQALGLPGLLLGWTPFMRNKVRQTVLGRLVKFQEGQGSTA